MLRLVISIIFLNLILCAQGQQGSPLLTHFSESRDIENQSWAIAQDSSHIMLFANRKGLLSFDGVEWSTNRLSVIPYAMQKSPFDGRIYIGGENNFGYAKRGTDASIDYKSLSGDSLFKGVITRIIFRDTVVWFYSSQSIVRYNLANDKADLVINARPGEGFTGMLINRSNTFINVAGKGLHRVESDTLFPLVTGYLTANEEVLFSLPYNSSMVLVGLGNGNLSLFDGIKYYDFAVKDKGYLKNSILSEGVAMGDTAYAFSTLDGGAVVIRKKDGQVLYMLNNENELPDDEVFGMGTDINGGLWLSHQYGLTRADLKLPISNFTIFSGLRGNLSTAVWYKGELYVASSEGIFYLSQEKDYDQYEVLVSRDQEVAAVDVPSFQSGSESSSTGTRDSRKTIFSRIFGGKSAVEKTESSVTRESNSNQVARKTLTRLRSVRNVYKKVEGLNEKCRQLVPTQWGLLAATNRGLYSISAHKAEIIVPGQYINYISWKPDGRKYWTGTNSGYFSIENSDGKWNVNIPDKDFSSPVYSIAYDKNGSVWMGGMNRVVVTSGTTGSNSLKYKEYKVENEFAEEYYLRLMNDTLFLFTGEDIYFYNTPSDTYTRYKRAELKEKSVSFNVPLSDLPLIRFGDEWRSISSSSMVNEGELSMLKLFDEVISVTATDTSMVIIDGDNKIFLINRDKSASVLSSVDVLIKSISNSSGKNFSIDDVVFDRGDNVVVFSIVAPDFIKPGTTKYQYFVDKAMEDWSDWSPQTKYSVPVYRQGEYVLQVRAKDLWGNTGEITTLHFTIKAPFIKTPAFYILFGSALLALIIVVVRFRERQLHIQNRMLEQKVKERTAEIEAQKAEITDSIEYAGRIQAALMPMEIHFKEHFSDYFILFRPRDIVSGDFYWIGEDDSGVFFTVADCTGHGVPGAFMSTLGISTLNEIVANHRKLEASTALNILREKTKRSLHQTGREGEAADGMDIAFCVLDHKKTTLQFSGAYSPLYIVQDGDLKEYKADRMPIGIHYGGEVPFTNYEIKVKKGDLIYMFSDGYADQFGGPDGTKFKKTNLRKLLTSIHNLPMSDQQAILEKELNNWRGTSEQIDDITVLGVKI